MSFIGLLLLVSLLILSLISYICKEIIVEWVKRQIFKERPVPRQIKKITYDIKIIIIRDFKNNAQIIKDTWADDIVEKRKEELTTKDENFYINAKSTQFLSEYLVKSTKCVYPTLFTVLKKEARIGLQLYLSYKTALKNNKKNVVAFIDKALNNVKSIKTKDYSFITKWFEIFKKLDLDGELEGLLVPLSKETKFTNDMVKDEFTKFVTSVYKNKKLRKFYKIGNLKVGIMRIGTAEKILPNYIAYIGYLKKLGCNKIIICGRGRWKDKVQTTSNITKLMFNMKENIFTGSMYASLKDLIIVKPSGYVIHAHLIKWRNLTQETYDMSKP